PPPPPPPFFIIIKNSPPFLITLHIYGGFPRMATVSAKNLYLCFLQMPYYFFCVAAESVGAFSVACGETAPVFAAAEFWLG
ncbi:MAG: hypothetical protein ACTTH7_05190, partial [Treponema sp.]